MASVRELKRGFDRQLRSLEGKLVDLVKNRDEHFEEVANIYSEALDYIEAQLSELYRYPKGDRKGTKQHFNTVRENISRAVADCEARAKNLFTGTAK